jgi:lipoprotein signal peptidase
VRGLQAARGASLTSQADGGPDRSDTEPGAPSARPRVVILLCVAVAVLAVDIASKTIVVATLSDRAPIRLLGGFLTLRESRNPGAAFSIGPSDTILFTVIAVGVIVFIIRTARRIYSLPWAVALGLLLGGATGNLTDRIFRSPGLLRGWVVDWIQVPHWPVFNLADSAIVCGGALMVLLAARGHRLDAAPPAERPARPARPAPPAAQPQQQPPAQQAPPQQGAQSQSAAPQQPAPQSAAAEQPQEHPSGGGSG